MSKKCAHCEKTVYPIEELKCLEKIWHKPCFKCQVCGMTLSMKNYKGFDKLPYCGAHVPKAKATVVADTPENRRLADNSKAQSLHKYHAEFEQSKGKFTSVTDDPESLRLKAASEVISNVTYHGVKNLKEDQEKKRSLVGGSENAPPPPREEQAPKQPEPYVEQHTNTSNSYESRSSFTKPQSSNAKSQEPKKSSYGSEKYDQSQPSSRQNVQVNDTPAYSHPSYSQQNSIQARSQPLPPAAYANQPPPYSNPPQQQYHPQQRHSQQQQQYTQQQPKQTHVQQQQQQQQHMRQQQQTGHPQQQRSSQQQQQYPTQQQFNQKAAGQYYQQYQPAASQVMNQQQQQQYTQQQQTMQQQQQLLQQQQHRSNNHSQAQPQQRNSQGVRCYQAIYDYEAQDTDEVSFKDGDIIVNAVPIDEGWMTGTVHRSGQSGMLPANYVEPINL